MATVKLLALDPTYGVPTETASTDVAQLGQLSLLGIGGVAINAGGNLISGVADPVTSQDTATKAYVDRLSLGISLVASVVALANVNVTLSGLQTIDSVGLNEADRILLTAQTDPKQNGVWIVHAAAWTRPTAADDYFSGRNLGGIFTYVESGTNFAGEQWAIVGANKGKVDSDPSSWTQLTGAAEIIAGNGLQKSAINGNTMSVVLAPNSGLTFTAAALDHLLNPAGGLNKAAAGLGITANANATVAVDANGVRTLGLPALFTVNGTAVDANVTGPNLSALNDGNSSLVDNLHSHQSVLEALATVATHKNGSVALSAGDPVQWSSTADTLQRCDAVSLGKSQCLGVAVASISANGTGKIVKRGIAVGVLSQATPGAPVYLAAGGGLTSALNTTFAGNVVRIGWAKNASDLDVQPQYMSQRGAN